MKTLLSLAGLILLTAPSLLDSDHTLQLDPQQSRIEVAVHATMDSFTAQLPRFQTDIVYDPAAGTVERATLVFDFHDLLTGKTRRDEEMHHWQETEHFPIGRFELNELQRVQPGRYVAHGILQLHGVRRPVQFPVLLAGNENTLSIDGEARLDVQDFGLKRIRKFGLLRVDPEVTVQFHLQGVLVQPVARQEPSR